MYEHVVDYKACDSDTGWGHSALRLRYQKYGVAGLDEGA